ncbi:uncharacterized protein MELLADRAFT_92460 [Melampsora larici-populina 98AG31]|uniref:Secreted protein n=1 Tax=Melampsora larici-populina (strain 98AG31 / pathotype 3-4-7) TaxID=747676 RepID=F4R9R6_MELLP|nr:uncharacterized protein MELLADRAFT_92460 [Melampsora larici-populina 98AG31]EGG11026.1 secreted protein [Melampsora larici-populina 98AG31]
MLLPFVTVSLLSATIIIAAPQATSSLSNIQQRSSPNLDAMNDGSSSPNSTSNNTSTRQSNSTQTQTSGNSTSLSTAIYGHLKTCHDGIQTHSTTIATHCGGANNENAQDSGSSILLEIQAILILTMTCAINIQASVAQHAASSGIARLFGGGGGSSGSASGSGSFSFSDCATMFFTLIKLLQGCYTQVAGVSYKFPAIRVLCADSLAQLSTCLSQIAHACGLAMPGFANQVNDLCADQSPLFMQTGFGFSQFMKMMKR